jgi:hypothetical protein
MRTKGVDESPASCDRPAPCEPLRRNQNLQVVSMNRASVVPSPHESELLPILIGKRTGFTNLDLAMLPALHASRADTLDGC